MFKFITPIILIVLGITMFFMVAKPAYDEISLLKQETSSYDQALSNSKALESERDKLTQKYNSIGGENLDRLAKMLPQSVDNIRLILEIEKIASPYGMALRDVKYDTMADTADTAIVGVAPALPGGPSLGARKEFGVWDLAFSVEGSYANFMSFLHDLENNLRIVDISSIEFTSNIGNNPFASTYKFNFKIKTYWLKN